MNNITYEFGIYQIRNIITNKIYIGSTSRTFLARKNEHFQELRRKKHGNTHLQQSFNKYGEHNFVFEILKCCSEADNLDKLEKLFYDNVPENERYNLVVPGETGKRGVSDKTRERMSNAHRGNKSYWWGKSLSSEHKTKISVSLTGRERSTESKQKLSVSTTKERNPMFGKKHSEETKMRISAAKKLNNPGWKKGVEKAAAVNKKRIQQLEISTNNIVCVYNSIKEAAMATCVSAENISRCASGKRKTCGGFLWRYA